MLKIFFTLFVLSVLLDAAVPVTAQTTDWTTVLPTKFPTNTTTTINGISRVSQLKFHPSNPAKMYAVSALGGLYISTDTGNNWQIANGTDKMPYCRTASVAIDPSNDQIIYLGTGDRTMPTGLGVWKSNDGGQNFSQTSLINTVVNELIIDPQNYNIVVAATRTGIYKTTDAGVSWTLKTTALKFEDLQLKSVSSRVLYASTYDSSFYRSTDFGDTWIRISNGIVIPSGISTAAGTRITVSPADTNVVYFGMVTNGGIFYRSADGGNSFIMVKAPGAPYLTYYGNSASSYGQGDYNYGIGTDRLNANILYLVSHVVWKSVDGGFNWTQLTINPYINLHTDMHQIITNPYNNNELWNMNDGGIFKSVDGGYTWNQKSDGISGYEAYHGVCSPTLKNMTYMGTQDNGYLYATENNWFTIGQGDAITKVAFDYRDSSKMIYFFDSRRRKLTDNSASEFGAGFGFPFAAAKFNDIVFHRSNPELAFLGDSIVYRTTNLLATTPSWTQLINLHQPIVAMHSNVGDASQLYIITKNGILYISNNALSASPGFTTVTLPSNNILAGSVSSIKSAPNHLYITCNDRVLYSVNNGASWLDITSNLPGANQVRILADEYYSYNELVFVASYNNVYYKVKNAANWKLFGNHLPTRTQLTDLSIFNDSTANSALRVATYGRGIWEAPVEEVRQLHADFETHKLSDCNGMDYRFADVSTGKIISRNWTFEGGTPASSTSEFPEVSYAAYGNYMVTLIVFDGLRYDTITRLFSNVRNSSSIPFTEGFEGSEDPPVSWYYHNNSPSGHWAKTSTGGGFGNSYHAMFYDNFNWNIPGAKDELIVKNLDFSNFSSLQLSFDVAYKNASFYSDTLAVLISTDCGTTYTSLYKKTGSQLSTGGQGGSFFIPTPSQWRRDTINLNSFLNQPNISIAFQNINNWTNALYIDNVSITGTPLATVKYIFTGNGNWSDSANWLNHIIPPPALTGNAEIIIDPATDGECILNIVQHINNSAAITVNPGKKFRIIGELRIQK